MEVVLYEFMSLGNVYILPQCFLQVSSWNQRLDQTWVQSPWLHSQWAWEILDTDMYELSTTKKGNMDAFHQPNVEQKKPDTKKHILYDFEYTEV